MANPIIKIKTGNISGVYTNNENIIHTNYLMPLETGELAYNRDNNGLYIGYNGRNYLISPAYSDIANPSMNPETQYFHGVADSANNANVATKLGTINVGSSTIPIYLNKGTPTQCNGTLDVNISKNAATATKWAKGITISINGTANNTTSYTMDGSSNIDLKLPKALSGFTSIDSDAFTGGVWNGTTIAVAYGGTGATTAANARTNLGVPPTNHASSATTYGAATGTNYGHVKLSDATNSSSAASDGIAASSKAVKSVYDYAATKIDSTTASIELNHTGKLLNYGGFIDFHYFDAEGNPRNSANEVVSATPDYTSRIIESSPGSISVNGVSFKGSSITSGTWNGSAIMVGYGGTGKTSHTTNAVLVGNNTNNIKNIASASGAFYATSANGEPQFGTLPVAQGGTGATTLTSGAALIGNGTGTIATRSITNNTTAGSSIAASTNLITANTLANWNGAYNTSGNSNITNLGTISKGVWNGTTVAIAYGGTGLTANPSMLINLGSTSADTVFEASPRPGVTGVLGVANGGTGASTFTSGAALIGAGTGAITTRNITNNTSKTAVTASTNLITANTLYYHSGNSNITTVGTINSGTWNGATVAVSYGGTGNTSQIANRLIYSEAASKLSSSGHYASSSKIAINSTAVPTETLYVNGTLKASGNTTIGGTLTSSGDVTVNSGLVTIYKETSIANNYPAKLAFSVKQTDNNITTSSAYIAVYDDHDAYTYGTNMVITSPSALIIGSGESASNFYTAAIKGTSQENTYITADTSINFFTKCDTIADRVGVALDTSRQFYPILSANGGAGSLGTDAYYWKNAYLGITNFKNGHIYLNGSNASSSTGNTTQLVFGTSTANHIVLSANDKALVINPTISSTANQIVLYLNSQSLFPNGISITQNTNGTKGNLSVSGNATISSNLSVTGTSTLTGNTSIGGILDVAGQIKTSFKDSIAVGSYQATSATVGDLINEVRYSSGCMGSVSLTAAYSKDNVTIPGGWYNFMYIPHRSGGINGGVSGDNCNYGTLFLTGMTASSGYYRIRFSSETISECERIIGSAGGTIAGALSVTGNITGSQLQTTAVTAQTTANKIATIDDNGWIHYITPANLVKFSAFTGGTTEGPKINLLIGGTTTATSAVIPAATGSASGIVTTTTQTFAGDKTFTGTINGNLNGSIIGQTKLTSTTANTFVETNRFKWALVDNSVTGNDGVLMSLGWSNAYGAQIWLDDGGSAGGMAVRNGTGTVGSWNNWLRVVTLSDFSTQQGSAALPVYVDGGGKVVACTAGSIFSSFSSSGNTLTATIATQTRDATIINTVSNAWANGTTAGPTLTTTINGVAGSAVAIPVASASYSGVVTTGAQTFAGEKTINTGLTLAATAQIKRAGTSTSWYLGRSNALIKTTSYSGYNAIASLKTTNGDWSIGVYTSDILYFTYVKDTDFNAGSNTTTAQIRMYPDGTFHSPKLASTNHGTGNPSGSATTGTLYFKRI